MPVLSCDCSRPPATTRRSWMQLAGGCAGALLLHGRARAAGKTDALLLSCMDYRLVDDIERYMAGRGLRDRYDHIILAGASLGASSDRFPAWNQTFWEHLDVAIKLHAIHTVILMDHRDCGAYKVILGEDAVKTSGLETTAHRSQLHGLRAEVLKRHPGLKVETLIMALDGKVEAL